MELDTTSSFGGSSSGGSYDPDPIMPLGLGSLNAHDSYCVRCLLPPAEDSVNPNAYESYCARCLPPPAEDSVNPAVTPSLLIPQISMTPETTVLVDGHTTV
jgi:hypothetical protein